MGALRGFALTANFGFSFWVWGWIRYVVRRADPGCELFTAADLRSRCFRQEDGDHAGFYQYRRTVLEWMHNSLQQEDSYCFIAAEAAAPEERRVIGTLDATVHTALVVSTCIFRFFGMEMIPDRDREGGKPHFRVP